jgi:hypothetical protein
MPDDAAISKNVQTPSLKAAVPAAQMEQLLTTGRADFFGETKSSVPPERILTRDQLASKLMTLDRNKRPFAVFLGAGASYSAGIPLAGEIVQMIEDKCAAEVGDCQPRDYATLMAKLLPGRRYELLKDKVNGAKLNMAHLYLAALVKSGWVDVVLTTNFDPLIVRAAASVNIRLNVYDVPNTKNFQHMDIMSPAVVYLHGQFNSFITVHALAEDKAILGDAEYALSEAVKGRSLVVVGYSGESDPIFNKLCEREQYRNGLFWINHTNADPKPHVLNKLLQAANKYAFYIRSEPADLFFPGIARALGVRTTHIASRPFVFLKEWLDNLAWVQTDLGTVDFASDARDQVQTAALCFEEDKRCPRAADAVAIYKRDDALRRAREAWLEGRYAELDGIERDARAADSTDALVFVAKAQCDYARKLDGVSAIEAFDMVINKFGKDTKPALMEQVAGAFINKGITLGRLDRSEEEIKVYDDVVGRFGNSTEIDLLEKVARALVNKGVALGRLSRSEEEIKVYDDVVGRFGNSTETDLLEKVARALNNKGVALGRIGRSEEDNKDQN